MFIDSHCHLQDDKFQEDLDSVIKNAQSESIGNIVCIGTNIEESQKAIELANKYSQVYATIGLYPHETPVSNYMEQLNKLAKHPKVIGIGECGMDFYEGDGSYKLNDSNTQQQIFESQIKLALTHNLPLIIHTRNADTQTLEILAKYKNDSNLRGVFHCFVGSYEFATQILELGFYISFTGIITYPSAQELIEVIKRIPTDKILIETDAPYLAPQKFRGKRNEPKYVKIVGEKLAQIWNKSIEDTATITTENTLRLFDRIKTKHI